MVMFGSFRDFGPSPLGEGPGSQGVVGTSEAGRARIPSLQATFPREKAFKVRTRRGSACVNAHPPPAPAPSARRPALSSTGGAIRPTPGRSRCVDHGPTQAPDGGTGPSRSVHEPERRAARSAVVPPHCIPSQGPAKAASDVAVHLRAVGGADGVGSRSRGGAAGRAPAGSACRKAATPARSGSRSAPRRRRRCRMRRTG